MKNYLLLTGILFLFGCAHDPAPPQAQSGSTWQVEIGKYEGVELSRPRILTEGDELIIEGTVKRKPGYTGDIDDKVAIVFGAADGQYLDQLLLSLDPATVPGDARGSAYFVRYGWIPPKGAIIYVDMGGKKTIPLTGGPAGAVSTINNGSFTNTPDQPTRPIQPQQPTRPNIEWGRQPVRGRQTGRY